MSVRGAIRAVVTVAIGAGAALAARSLWARFRRAGKPADTQLENLDFDSSNYMDAGWVEVLSENTAQTVARGRVLVEREAYSSAAAAMNTQSPIAESERVAWRGRLDPLRPAAAGAIRPGRYRVRFERNGQELMVNLEGWESMAAGRGSARLRSADGELPSVLLELGGH